MPDETTTTAPLFCARCAGELHPGLGDHFEVCIDARADPAPPVITDEDLNRDVRADIADLLARMESMSAREALDQVHRRLVLHLCLRCFAAWIENPTG